MVVPMVMIVAVIMVVMVVVLMVMVVVMMAVIVRAVFLVIMRHGVFSSARYITTGRRASTGRCHRLRCPARANHSSISTPTASLAGQHQPRRPRERVERQAVERIDRVRPERRRRAKQRRFVDEVGAHERRPRESVRFRPSAA